MTIFCGQSDSHNLKYMGIDALGRLIKISPEIAEQHQLAVIDCLEVRNIFYYIHYYSNCLKSIHVVIIMVLMWSFAHCKLYMWGKIVLDFCPHSTSPMYLGWLLF